MSAASRSAISGLAVARDLDNPFLQLPKVPASGTKGFQTSSKPIIYLRKPSAEVAFSNPRPALLVTGGRDYDPSFASAGEQTHARLANFLSAFGRLVRRPKYIRATRKQ